MHHYQLSSISGRRPPIRDLTKLPAVVNRGPVERSQNTAEGKVFTGAEFRSVYMEWGYLTVGTMNAAGKQREIFVALNKTGRKLTWLITFNECKLKVVFKQILKHRLKEGPLNRWLDQYSIGLYLEPEPFTTRCP